MLIKESQYLNINLSIIKQVGIVAYLTQFRLEIITYIMGVIILCTKVLCG